MEKSTENNNNKNFLKEGLKGDISKHHKQYLGTEIPEGYFAKSKISILEKIKEETISETASEKKNIVFWMKPRFKFAVAASLAFMLSLTIWLKKSNKTKIINESNFELLAFSDDVLLESLLIEDSDFEAFTEATLFNEILLQAELSEQKLDNLVLDNLIIGDSLLDDYINKGLIENIIF
jgi:hypothetical protein